MIHVLNNLPHEYEVIFNGLENCLTASGDDALMMDVICKKLNHWYEKLKTKMKKKEKKKRFYEPIINNMNKGAINVVSMITSLVTEQKGR